jgi:hypothetical protein
VVAGTASAGRPEGLRVRLARIVWHQYIPAVGRLWSKSAVGQVNEALCKVLRHNVCVLIQSIHELGIEPTFPTLAATRAG